MRCEPVVRLRGQHDRGRSTESTYHTCLPRLLHLLHLTPTRTTTYTYYTYYTGLLGCLRGQQEGGIVQVGVVVARLDPLGRVPCKCTQCTISTR